MTIRKATLADIPRIVDMGRRFFEAMANPLIGDYSEEAAAATAKMLIESDDGILLVGPHGMAGALVYPFYMTGQSTAQELFWWVDPDHRGMGQMLLTALESAARAKGAETMTMIALENLNPDAVGAIYRRAGYRPSEHSYIRRL